MYVELNEHAEKWLEARQRDLDRSTDYGDLWIAFRQTTDWKCRLLEPSADKRMYVVSEGTGDTPCDAYFDALDRHQECLSR